MITQLHLKNFKSHADSKLELSNLNIFTGMNGIGKSSIIQTLLLLRQSNGRRLLRRGLDLNGDLCSIGVAKDAIYQFAEDSDNIDIALTSSKNLYKWSFNAGPSFLSDTFVKSNNANTYNLEDIALFNNHFQYISAFRNGPVNDYDKDTSSVELLEQISRKEGRCELVAHFLYHFKNNHVADAIKRNSDSDSLLKNQVEEWMREVSTNINIHVNPMDTSFQINYSFNRGKNLVKTDEMRSSNIGFGVSYVLPIVVAILKACTVGKDNLASKRDNLASKSLIIIENPEAHIHPSGQAKLMELICRAAKLGVQFIIETHSDHIVNGLLVGVKKALLNADKAKVYYLGRDETKHATTVHPLEVLEGGKIRKPPAGFFDQIDIDMKTLMGF